MAKWLYDKNKSFNVFSNDGDAFKNACQKSSSNYSYLNTAKFLFEIDPKTALQYTKDIFYTILHTRNQCNIFDTAIWLYEIDPTLQNEENDKLLRDLFDREMELKENGYENFSD